MAHSKNAPVKKLFTKEPWKKALVLGKQGRSEDWIESTANMVVDFAAGITGGVGGSFLGFWSVPLGLALSFTGHATGHRWLTALGIGSIAAPLVRSTTSRTAPGSGFNLKAEIEDGKERARGYVSMLKDKFYINKLFGSSDNSSDQSSDTAVSGLDPGVNRATLDQLTDWDQQIVSDGVEYHAQRSAGSGADTSMSGVSEVDEIPHII